MISPRLQHIEAPVYRGHSPQLSARSGQRSHLNLEPSIRLRHDMTRTYDRYVHDVPAGAFPTFLETLLFEQIE
jgi:hypothetical protein